MSVVEKQARLIAELSIISDPQERLAVVTERARRLEPFPSGLKGEDTRVPGCVSRVWLIGSMEGGRFRFLLDAESSVVKGLAGLLVEIYNGASGSDILATEPTVLDSLHLADHLSPTRKHGLAQVRLRIRQIADELSNPKSPPNTGGNGFFP